MVLYCNLERTFVVTDVLYTGPQTDKCSPRPRPIPITHHTVRAPLFVWMYVYVARHLLIGSCMFQN